MAKRTANVLKEFFGAGAVPTAAHFADLIDSFEDALAPTTLTVVTGAISRTQKRHRLETEGQKASDTLSTIDGGSDGVELILRLLDSSRTVNVDTAGNIAMSAGAHNLNSTTAHLHLIFNGDTNKWNELSRSS